MVVAGSSSFEHTVLVVKRARRNLKHPSAYMGSLFKLCSLPRDISFEQSMSFPLWYMLTAYACFSRSECQRRASAARPGAWWLPVVS